MNKNTAKNLAKSNAARPVLETMTAAELKATCKALGVKQGKSNKAAIDNLCRAIDAGAAHFKAVCTISFKPEGGTRTTFFGKTLRTYVSGPGLTNDTWLKPEAAVKGSPAPAGD